MWKNFEERIRFHRGLQNTSLETEGIEEQKGLVFRQIEDVRFNREFIKPDWVWWAKTGKIDEGQLCALWLNYEPGFIEHLQNDDSRPTWLHMRLDERDEILRGHDNLMGLVATHDSLKFPMNIVDFGVSVKSLGLDSIFSLPVDFPLIEDIDGGQANDRALSDAFVVVGSLLKVLKGEKLNQEALLSLMTGESAKFKMHNIGERKLKEVFANGNKELAKRNS